MHGDFSQLTFSPLNRFSAVLRLQGRVDVDADANEATAILLHYVRTLAADVIGPYGGPAADAGFAITVTRQSGRVTAISIGPGRYYVDGLLVQSTGDDPIDFYAQPGAYLDPKRDPLPEKLPVLAYLKVWERLVTAVEDPAIRDVALGAGGPDSSARTQVVWQVILTASPPGSQGAFTLKSKTEKDMRAELLVRWRDNWLDALQGVGVALLRARAKSGDDDPEPCALSPFARYRGPENQLYRVEVHDDSTFKWSRDNGSVVFPIDSITQSQVVVSTLGRDDLLSVEVGQWVEVVDDASTAAGTPAPLYRVALVEELDRRVTLDRVVSGDVGRDPDLHPFLRRWDQLGDLEDGVIPITEASPGDVWLDLEDGVQVQFESGPYRPGDYWLIPARTETGDVIWPATDGEPDALRPRGPTIHYAPLGFITDTTVVDLRSVFDPLAG